MYTIYIRDLRVTAIIGILETERILPQLIVADCTIEYDKKKDIFINYADVVNLIEKKLVNQKYFLLEDALDDVIEEIYKKFGQIKSIKLKFIKPNILENCVVGVENFRKI